MTARTQSLVARLRLIALAASLALAGVASSLALAQPKPGEKPTTDKPAAPAPAPATPPATPPAAAPAPTPDAATAPVERRESQKFALEEVERLTPAICEMNKAIFDFAEVGLEEHKSSALLADKLAGAGFDVKRGVAEMPTAFVASYGAGKPVIAILAEYDALPGLSQKVSPHREPVTENGAGHGCGHSGLGSGAVGAALAVKAAMEKHKLPGTIRLYGTPAEETVIGKVYMTLNGAFDDVDVCLHWHPGTMNDVWAGSSKAVISAKFTFEGVAAHASSSPQDGRSALDGVELMNVGSNYMREHVKEDARIHHVIVNGGGQPNVVPALATVWYFVRCDDHNDAVANFKWLCEVANGAAMMSRTKVRYEIDTDCHEIITNTALSDLLRKHLTELSPPTFTEEEHEFARKLQGPLAAELGVVIETTLNDKVDRPTIVPVRSRGSTDVGDVSWKVPTSGIHTTCFVANSPGHSWQNVASIGSTIGEKGTVYAAKLLSLAALDLLEQPALVAAAKEDWEKRMKGREYTSLIPKGQKPPQKIR